MRIFANGHEREIDLRKPLTRYFMLIGDRTLGPMPTDQLRKVPGFTLRTLVRQADGEDWKPAFEVVNLGDYFAPTQRAASWPQADRKELLDLLVRTPRPKISFHFFWMLALGALTISIAPDLHQPSRAFRARATHEIQKTTHQLSHAWAHLRLVSR